MLFLEDTNGDGQADKCTVTCPDSQGEVAIVHMGF